MAVGRLTALLPYCLFPYCPILWVSHAGGTAGPSRRSAPRPAPAAETPQKPAASGVTVPSNDWPIAAPIDAAAERLHEAQDRRGRAGDMAERLHGDRVEVRADPAELQHGRREQRHEDADRQIGPSSARTNQIVLTARKPTSAPCDSRRMPKRPTSCELTKDDTAIMPATHGEERPGTRRPGRRCRHRSAAPS